MTMQHDDWPEYPLSAFDDETDLKRAVEIDGDRFTPHHIWLEAHEREVRVITANHGQHYVRNYQCRECLKDAAEPDPFAKYRQDGYDPS